MAARTGYVNGMYFDPEVFGEYMQEKSVFVDAIIASGIIREEEQIGDLIGSKGNIATLPVFASFADDDSLNFDGETDNVPVALQGKKQTLVKIARMRAWKDADFTRYLTGVSPLQNLADRLLVPYWAHQWQKVLLAELTGVMGVAAMAGHITDLSVTTGTIADTNKISATSIIELKAKAFGDSIPAGSLILMHSTVFARLRAEGLVNFDKYTIAGALAREAVLPTIDGNIVLVDDSLVDTTTEGYPVYLTYVIGAGAFLGYVPEVPNPYTVRYDPETDGGINKLYTKQARIMHPNGLSVKKDNFAKESPTNAELADSANWELCFNAKVVPIALLKTNG